MKLVITMSRRFGTGASIIADELSKRLDIPVYDRAYIEQLLERLIQKKLVKGKSISEIAEELEEEEEVIAEMIQKSVRARK